MRKQSIYMPNKDFKLFFLCVDFARNIFLVNRFTKKKSVSLKK